MKRELEALKKDLMKQVDALDIYLPVNDGSGELYNRKTGQRFKIELVKGKVVDAKSRRAGIFSDGSDKSQTTTKGKVGRWSH